MLRTALSSAFSFLIVVFVCSATAAQPPKDRFPVPEFKAGEGTEYQRGRLAILRASFNDMRNHLCQKTEPAAPGWEQRFFTLMQGIIVAQHNTVWALSGAIDEEEEQRRLPDAAAPVEAMLKKTAARLPAEKARMDSAARKLGNVWKEMREVAANRAIDNQSFIAVYGVTAYLAAVESELPPERRRALGIEDEYRRIRGEAQDWTANVKLRVYARTRSRLFNMMPPDAMAFAIYKHADFTEDQQKQISEAVAASAARLLPLPFTVKAPEFVALEEANWKARTIDTEFTPALRQQVMGGCSRKVRINFDPSRDRDSIDARNALERDNYVVERNMSAKMTEADKGRIFHRRASEAAGRQAAQIAELMQAYEPLTPAPRRNPPPDAPEYEFWLSNKNCGNRKNFDPSRAGGFRMMKALPNAPERPLEAIDTDRAAFDETGVFELIVDIQPNAVSQQGRFRVTKADGTVIARQTVTPVKATFTYCIQYKKGDVFYIYGDAASTATQYPSINANTRVYPVTPRE